MRTVLILLLYLLCGQNFAAVHQFTLDNGLKILVQDDHRAPVAVVMVWYQVGAANDPAGMTGIAHALEHLMFKGTARHPAGTYSKIIANHGGQENAFTTHDYTAYFVKIAVQHLPLALALEADRMQNLTLDAHEFTQELKVIREERRMRTEDNPQALTFERFMATAHLSDPYHHPVIGWMADLKHLDRNDVKDWYQRYYTPNQATLVIVGDVDADQVFKLAQKTFGHQVKRAPPHQKPQHEPPFLGKKIVTVHGKAQIPVLIRGFTVPSIGSMRPKQINDPYALELIATILDAGDNGRLVRELTRDNPIASSIGVNYNLYTRFDTQFMIYGAPTQKHTLRELSHAIDHELTRLKHELIPAAELERVKRQLIAQKTYERDSLLGQAMELGMLETIGKGFETATHYNERIQQITPQHVQQAAQLYFQDVRQTDARLIPLQGVSP